MTPKLNRVIRLDSVPLGRAFFTDEGYLMDKPILTSTGIFEYKNPDGSVRRELRLPEDVFDPESLKSYVGKPVVITHDAGLIDKNNVGEEMIGSILSEGYRDGDDVRAEIVIHDTDAMRKSHFKELSLGYNLECEEKPGVWKGQPYDAIQRNIRINHLALVREARAGDQARLNIDGRDSETTLKGGKAMRKATHKKTRRNDGVLSPEELQKAIAEYKASRKKGAASDGEEEVKETPVTPEALKDEDDEPVIAPAGKEEKMDDEAIEEQVEEIKKNNTDADADMQKLFDIIDTLLAQKDFDEAEPEEKPEVLEDDDDEPIPDQAAEDEDEDPTAEAEEEVAEDEDDEECNEDEDDDDIPTQGTTLNTDSIDRIVRQRVQLGIVGQALNMDGLENMKLSAAKKAVIRAVRPGMRLDGKSRAYINAAFDAAVADVKAGSRKDTNYQKRQMFNRDSRTVISKKTGAEAARDRMIAKQQNRNKEGK